MLRLYLVEDSKTTFCSVIKCSLQRQLHSGTGPVQPGMQACLCSLLTQLQISGTQNVLSLSSGSTGLLANEGGLLLESTLPIDRLRQCGQTLAQCRTCRPLRF